MVFVTRVFIANKKMPTENRRKQRQLLHQNHGRRQCYQRNWQNWRRIRPGLCRINEVSQMCRKDQSLKNIGQCGRKCLECVKLYAAFSC